MKRDMTMMSGSVTPAVAKQTGNRRCPWAVWRLWVCVAAMAVALSGCGGASGGDAGGDEAVTEYLPVRLAGSTRWSLLDVNSGTVLARDAFAEVPSPVACGMFSVLNADGTYDCYDVAAPTTVVSGGYGSVTPYSADGVAVASRPGGRLCVIDREGKVRGELPAQVAQCSMFAHGVAAVQHDDGLWGLVDTHGDTVVAAQYASMNLPLHSRYAVATSRPQADSDGGAVTFTVIDTRNGKVKFSASTAEYEPVQPYYVDGVLPVVHDDSLVCLSPEGKVVDNPNPSHERVDAAGYDDYQRTPWGDFTVVRGGKTGLVDRENRELIGVKHDRLIAVSRDRLIAVDDTLCHLVDRTGKAVGDAAFTLVHGTAENPYASRGYLDTSLAAAALMTMFDESGACGVVPGSTLMDLNSLVGSDAVPYVGSNTLVMPQGPCVVHYVFDRDIATAAGTGGATFNLDARVRCVIMSMNVRHCPPNTEEEIVNKMQGSLGRLGFVLARDGIFVSDKATAVTMGYSGGVVNVLYYMHFNESVPQPKNKRGA